MVLDSYSRTRVHDNEHSIFIKIESKASKKQDSDRNRSDLFHRNWRLLYLKFNFNIRNYQIHHVIE
jgi:hypothetical protein